MKQQQTVTSHVHGWLMNVPNYRQDYSTVNNSHIEIKKERPMSVTSISSEDSVDLDELISVNYTTIMEEEEADLSVLSLLDLDDSKEDFWKVDTVRNKNPSLLFYLFFSRLTYLLQLYLIKNQIITIKIVMNQIIIHFKRVL